MSVELGRLVQQRRHELGLSRRDLEKSSGVSYPYISQIENGDREPSLKTMRLLADVLELPVEQLAASTPPSEWTASPSQPMAIRARPRSSYDDPAELYREKVLPAVERRLASVPPLVRITLLNELIAAAVTELNQS